MTIEQHAEAADREINLTSARDAFDGIVMSPVARSETRKEIIARHMQSAIDEATVAMRESWLRVARYHSELWDFIQQSHEKICEAAGVECVHDDAMVDLVPVAVNAINKLKARIAELEWLGALIDEILNFAGDVAAMPVDEGIEQYRTKAAAILKGGA